MSKVAVVILNYNGVDFLQKFLPTVIAYTPDAEIIVADNASTDTSVDVMKEKFPNIRLIQNKENTGFAGGYNNALQHVKADYYLLLNSDVEVTPNWLQPLQDCLDQNEEIAACQPKVLAHHDKTKFEHAGAAGGFLDYFYYPLCRGRIFDTVEVDHGQYDNNIPIFWSTGACMLIRSRVFHEIGGFDDRFFAHMEEIDLCWRIQSLGYSIYFVHESKVYHVGGGTLNYMSPFKTFLNFRNSLFTIHKNHIGHVSIVILWRLILDGIAGAKFIFGGQFRHCIAVVKAHFHYYRNLRYLQNQRKIIQAKRVNNKPYGILKRSIVWRYFVKGEKTFDKIRK